MRKGAGTTYAVVKVLKLNATVTILEESGSWYKVTSGNDTGYISKDYVSNTKKVTNRSLTEQREDKDEKENENINDDSQTTTKVSQTNKDDNKSDSSVDNKTTSSKNETNSADKKDTSQSTSKTSNTGSSSATKTNNTSNKTSTTTSSKNEVKGSDIVAYAKKFLGYKYVWGGDGSNGTFDCSGFTMYVYKHFGVSLPHYTVSQYNSGKGKKITKQSELKMGDIVYLTDYISGAPCGHCGIYIENGKFIHADSTVMKVNISDLNGMYKGRFCGALRVF